MIYYKRKKKTKKKIDNVDNKLPKKSKPKKKFRFKKRIKDLAVLELKKDVKLSPKVKISANVSVPTSQVLPICLPSSGGSDYEV